MFQLESQPDKQNNNFWRNQVIVSQMVMRLSLLMCLDLMQTTRTPLLIGAQQKDEGYFPTTEWYHHSRTVEPVTGNRLG